MTAEELRGWIEYEQTTGVLGHHRQDAFFAQQAALFANANRSSKQRAFTLADFAVYPNPLLEQQSRGYKVNDKNGVNSLKQHFKALAKLGKKGRGEVGKVNRKSSGNRNS